MNKQTIETQDIQKHNKILMKQLIKYKKKTIIIQQLKETNKILKKLSSDKESEIDLLNNKMEQLNDIRQKNECKYDEKDKYKYDENDVQQINNFIISFDYKVSDFY